MLSPWACKAGRTIVGGGLCAAPERHGGRFLHRKKEGVMKGANLTDAELVAGLRCCVKDPGDEAGCKACPLDECWEDESGAKCYDRLNLAAAERLEELSGYAGKLILAQNELLELREKKGEPDG